MENYQKIEQLVNNTGCSYEDAKTALERCGWDMIDAVISLEREGKIKKETAGQTAQKAEEGIEIVTDISVENVSGNDSGQVTYSYDDAAGSQGNTGRTEGRPKREHKLFKRIKSILFNNRMVVIKSNGQQMMDLPLIFPIIALIAFFWATLIIAAVAMVFGFRFHFEGQDLGKTNINSTMDKATDYAEKVKNDLSKKVNNEQNTDN